MKILFICDLNSVHSQKWISYFIRKGHSVHIYTTTPFAAEFKGAPVYGRRAGVSTQVSAGQPSLLSSVYKSSTAQAMAGVAERLFVSRKTFIIRRQTFDHVKEVSKILPVVQPDVIHSLRIPNEGFTGALLPTRAPLVISTWGNDLTFWAKKPVLRELTEMTLKKAAFLFSDCERDVALCRRYGYPEAKPHLVLPGSGGMFREDIDRGKVSLKWRSDFFRENYGIHTRPILLSLRGFGSQDIDNVPLLRACRILFDEGVTFTLVIAGKKDGFRYYKLQRLVNALKISDNVRLVDALSHDRALEALQGADLSISVSRNDGTPNSMLEAMTFGAVPLMSDIDSIREWIKEGVNGFLFDPRDPESIADSIKRTLANKAKLPEMSQRNLKIIEEKAEYAANMSKAESLLNELMRR